MLEVTLRTPCTFAASFAASSSATLSTIGTVKGSVSMGVFHAPLVPRRPGASTTGRHERGAVGLRLRHRALHEGEHLVLGELAAGGEAPCAVGQHADADAERLGIIECLHAVLAGEDALAAVLGDAHIGVLRAGLLGGVDAEEREILDRGVAGGAGRAGQNERLRGGVLGEGGDAEGGRGGAGLDEEFAAGGRVHTHIPVVKG